MWCPVIMCPQGGGRAGTGREALAAIMFVATTWVHLGAVAAGPRPGLANRQRHFQSCWLRPGRGQWAGVFDRSAASCSSTGELAWSRACLDGSRVRARPGRLHPAPARRRGRPYHRPALSWATRAADPAPMIVSREEAGCSPSSHVVARSTSTDWANSATSSSRPSPCCTSSNVLRALTQERGQDPGLRRRARACGILQRDVHNARRFSDLKPVESIIHCRVKDFCFGARCGRLQCVPSCAPAAANVRQAHPSP